jgi:hypothetical protein
MASESQSSRSPRVDPSLARLFDVERRIEERLREAEREAARRVEEARASSEQSLTEARVALDAALRDAERADLDRHAEALRRIEADRQSRLAALSGIAEAEVDRIAREVLAIVLRDDGRRP